MGWGRGSRGRLRLKICFCFCTLARARTVPIHDRLYNSFLNFTLFLSDPRVLLLGAEDQIVCLKLFPVQPSSDVCVAEREVGLSLPTRPSCAHADLQCMLPL